MPPPSSPALSAPLDWRPPLVRLNLDSLPPLPPLPSTIEGQRALTHKSANIDRRALNFTEQDYDAEISSYRPLEWLGDAKLSELVSVELYRRFPRAASGSFATTREKLTSNYTISHISLAYGLPSRLRVGPDVARHSLQQSQNVAADLLEAYIGALVVSGGAGADLHAWVRELLSPIVMPTLVSDMAQLIAAAQVNGTGRHVRAGTQLVIKAIFRQLMDELFDIKDSASTSTNKRNDAEYSAMNLVAPADDRGDGQAWSNICELPLSAETWEEVRRGLLSRLGRVKEEKRPLVHLQRVVEQAHGKEANFRSTGLGWGKEVM
ncbi:hypothetical protein JCM8547_004616 [Rhodosporidiobolus lusitaniae]